RREAKVMPKPDRKQVALARQIEASMKAIASACAPLSAAEGDAGMLEAGLTLVVEALEELDALTSLFRERRTDYCVALVEGGRSARSIGQAIGMSDVSISKAVKAAREA